MTATLLWFRRDLRLSDNPALADACRRGAPVIPVFILSPEFETMGAAARWRLAASLEALDASLRAIGSRLVLRRGDPEEQLRRLVRETGATALYWSRLYTPEATSRDARIKSGLTGSGIETRSFRSSLLFEPWTVQTGQGGMYRVYSPYWRAVRDRDPGDLLPVPPHIPAPSAWPMSEPLADWSLGRDMRRGAKVVSAHTRAGEDAAHRRLSDFLAGPIADYATRRDFPGENATSGMSDHLTYGEISPRTLWHAAQRALHDGAAGAEHFLKELVWREFAWHLLFHTPHIRERNWRDDWQRFPWRGDNDDAERWRRGMTGEPFVDAAMREMYVTGRMHNRARMIAASYLTKHLLTDWRVGQAWFAECLTDWDEASNAMGWQWVAGSGPDAAPYFRVFNPALQMEKFDPAGAYAARWIAEGRRHPHEDALSFFNAAPPSWGLDPSRAYPEPVVALSEGRKRALEALDGARG